jgi:hypothetical protein
MAGTLSVNCVVCVIILSAAQIVAQSAPEVAPATGNAGSVQSSATSQDGQSTPNTAVGNATPGQKTSQDNTAAPNGASNSKATGEGARATQSSSSPAAQSEEPQSEEPEHQISPKEAEELFRSVDQILNFASKDTALPIRHEVKRKLTSRDEVEKYVQKHMEDDEDAQRLRRSELVLKKFGLLPRDFDLGSFLVKLLREQVAGYYDTKTKVVNLLDWIGPDQQKPVLAHELTHALQDQSYNLEKWMKAADVDLDKKKDPTPEDIVRDEALTARQAVVEGQAMVVLIDYMLAPTGRSVEKSPELLKQLQEGMLVGTADSPEFKEAPIYLKEAMTFPYRYGVDFVAQVLIKQGKQKAYADALTNPPNTSRQIMEPEKYMAGERIEPMKLVDFEHDFKGYDRFDIGAVGEFDVAVMIDQYAGVERSKQLYPDWRGGYYYAARPKGDAAAPLGILYVSRWASAEKASQFAAVYGESLKKRYAKAQEIAGDGVPVADDKTPRIGDQAPSLTGRHTWKTEEGMVLVEVKGDTVLVAESLDDVTTQKLEQDVFPVEAAGK